MMTFASTYRYSSVEAKNFQLVEHLLRKGNRQLRLLKEGSVISFRPAES